MNETNTMTAPVSQDDINAAVWAACDTFRGTVDPSIYKDYVLTMLFLKYVSDVWQDHYDATSAVRRPPRADRGNAEERALRAARPSASFYALHTLRHSPGNGERIDKALHAIEEANITKLRDVFPGHQLQQQQAGRRAAEERHPAPPAGRLFQA
jgi:type I restriction enzyme M protein